MDSKIKWSTGPSSDSVRKRQGMWACAFDTTPPIYVSCSWPVGATGEEIANALENMAEQLREKSNG